jgi:hypothetical protein
MFDQFFKSPRAVERHSTSPLLEERLRYLARCARQGSTKSAFTRWLNAMSKECQLRCRN